MFLTTKRSGYDASGLFLMMFDHPLENSRELRACVRFVSMGQLGHFMMGRVRIGGYSICLSGALGSDGLPINLNRYFVGVTDGYAKYLHFTDTQKMAIWDQLTPLPEELAEIYWHDDGHNTVGRAGPALRKWAKENLTELRKTIHKC